MLRFDETQIPDYDDPSPISAYKNVPHPRVPLIKFRPDHKRHLLTALYRHASLLNNQKGCPRTMRPPRLSTVATFFLVASSGSVAPLVWAKKDVTPSFMLGDMSVNTLASSPLVTSLLNTLLTTTENGPEDAKGYSDTSDAKVIADVLTSSHPPSPEADLLLDTLTAGETTCPLGQTKAGAGIESGMNQDFDPDQSSCDNSYELCFTSCSAGTTKRHWWLPSRKTLPAPGACELVCAVAQEGCQSCSRKVSRKAMFTKLRSFVPDIVSSVFPSLLYLLTTFTTFWIETLVVVYHLFVKDQWVATSFVAIEALYWIARSSFFLESIFSFIDDHAIQALVLLLLWSTRKILHYRKEVVDLQQRFDKRFDEEVETRVRALLKELRIAEENSRILREQRSARRRRGRLDSDTCNGSDDDGGNTHDSECGGQNTIRRREESGNIFSAYNLQSHIVGGALSLRMVVGFFADRLPLIGRS